MKTSGYEKILESMAEGNGFTYRKILRVDLERDRCAVLKSDPHGWQPGEGPMTGQMAQFSLSGAIHPEDAERFVTFTRLDQLRRVSGGGQETLSMIYRRKAGDGYRWNLMEVIPDQDPGFAILCMKDVDDAFREGVEREGLAIQTLEDRAFIISSMSSLFFSTYYINLNQDTFRAVNQLSRVGDVLGNEVNYTTALTIYANHFIHPDDRTEYLSTMGVENLKNRLRWWRSCVVFEYRRLSEEPGDGADSWSWVRASVVLARAGEDDLPKTAVYVAQDISGGRRDQNAGDT